MLLSTIDHSKKKNTSVKNMLHVKRAGHTVSERSTRLLSGRLRTDFPVESRILLSELSEIALLFLGFFRLLTAVLTSSSTTTDCFGVEYGLSSGKSTNKCDCHTGR